MKVSPYVLHEAQVNSEQAFIKTVALVHPNCRGEEAGALDDDAAPCAAGEAGAASECGAVVPALTVEEPLPKCAVHVTASLAFDAVAVIRHSAWDAGKRQTICGIEFLRMAIPDRRRLEHYVSQLSARRTPARA